MLWPLDLSVCFWDIFCALLWNFAILWWNFLDLFGLFGEAFWKHLGPFRHHIGNYLETFWDPFWVLIKVCYPIGNILGCVILGPFRDMFGTFYGHLFWLFETTFSMLECINILCLTWLNKWHEEIKWTNCVDNRWNYATVWLYSTLFHTKMKKMQC